MKMDEYIKDVKLELTGNVLNLEIPDATIGDIINKSFRELQTYIDTPKIITIPFASCIDMKGFEVSSITRIYRTDNYMNSDDSSSNVDPLYFQMITSFTNSGSVYNLNNWVMNYASYSTLQQIRNTMATDLAFRYDKVGEKLYISCTLGNPVMITVEYIPVYKNVEDIVSDYWIDMLIRLSVAQTKLILGRIRSRYTQNNAQWSQDGETILAEGKEELDALREMLRANNSLCYDLD